jgi:hypothetical protein
VIAADPGSRVSARLSANEADLVRLRMGPYDLHVFAGYPWLPEAVADSGLDVAMVLAPGGIADFTGYYLPGPVNPAYQGRTAGLAERVITEVSWDRAQVEFLPSAATDRRPWPWLPRVQPFILGIHGSIGEPAFASPDMRELVAPQAVGAWVAGLTHLKVRPLTDPIVLMSCAAARSLEVIADETGRLAYGSTGDISIGAEPVSLASPSAGVRAQVSLYSTDDGLDGQFRSAYPRGPAGDRVRNAYREWLGIGDVSWLAGQFAPAGTVAPAALRLRRIEGSGGLFGWSFYDEREWKSRRAAFSPARIGRAYVTWTPSKTYQPGTSRQPDLRTGLITRQAEPWHVNAAGTLPFDPGQVLVAAGYFADGQFLVTGQDQDVTYRESPLKFGLRLRQEHEAVRGRTQSRPVVLLTDHEPVPPWAAGLVAHGLQDTVVTVSRPATMYLDDHPSAGIPETQVALLPGSSPPYWTRIGPDGVAEVLTSPVPSARARQLPVPAQLSVSAVTTDPVRAEASGASVGVPALPASAGAGSALSAAELAAAVAAARPAKAGGAGRELAGSLEDCVGVVRSLLRTWLYPQGVQSLGPVGGTDDTAVATGGVAGVRERLMAGRGWAQVGSWDALEATVEAAGAGAVAVVLVSYAGSQKGHALAVYHTSEGLRWADPDGRKVSGQRPAAVLRAVAGWAVVIGGDGRVAEAAGWTAPEWALALSGAVGTLADPPLRHDFGAMAAPSPGAPAQASPAAGTTVATGPSPAVRYQALKAELTTIFGGQEPMLADVPDAGFLLGFRPSEAPRVIRRCYKWDGQSPLVLMVREITLGQLPAMTAWTRRAAPRLPSGLFLLLPAGHVDARERERLGRALVKGVISAPSAIREYELHQLHPGASELAVFDASNMPEPAAVTGTVEVDEALRLAVEKHTGGPADVGADGVARVSAAALSSHHQSWWLPEQDGPEPDFGQVADEVAARLDAGGPAIEYMLADATGGLGDPGRGGLKWGIETEFRFPPGWSPNRQRAAARKILAALRQAGLTTMTGLKEYHGGSFSQGYTEARNGWVLEEELEPGDWELVSPIMRDSPWVWEDLATIYRILREHEAVPDTGAGWHVHVSLGQAGADPRVYRALLDLVRRDLDLWFRWGANISKVAHPGAWASVPPRNPPRGGYRDLAHLRSWHGTERYVAVNLEHVSGGLSDHVEFRFFDDTLNEAEAQVRVKLVLALVHAALRAGLGPPGAGPEAAAGRPLGSRAGARQRVRRRGQPGQPTVFGADSPADAARATRLLQVLFRRQSDRRQAMALHVLTPWYGGLGARDLTDLDRGLVLPAAVPGLEPLQRLARIFLARAPGGVMLTTDWGSKVAGAEAVTRLLAAPWTSQAFAVVLSVMSLKGQPTGVITGIPRDSSRDPHVELTPEVLAALLPHLGWQPGTPLALGLRTGAQDTESLRWARQFTQRLEAIIGTSAELQTEPHAAAVQLASYLSAGLPGYLPTRADRLRFSPGDRQLDSARLQQLLTEILTSQPSGAELEVALAMIANVSDQVLRETTADGQVLRLLATVIPAEHRYRAALRSVLATRWEGTAETVLAGGGRFRRRWRPGPFTPGMLSPYLAGIRMSDPLTPEAVVRIGRGTAALTSIGLGQVVRRLSELAPADQAQAAWWLHQASNLARSMPNVVPNRLHQLRAALATRTPEGLR